MRELLSEANRLQYASTILHRGWMLLPKIAYIVLTSAIFMIDDIRVYIAVIAINLMLPAYIRGFRLIYGSAIIYSIFIAIIVLIDIVSGTLTYDVLKLLSYGYATFTCLALFYATTPPHHLRRLFGLSVFTLSYMLIRYSIVEVVEIIDSCRSRGLKLGLNPFPYIKVLFTIPMILASRMWFIEDSLRSRGVSE